MKIFKISKQSNVFTLHVNMHVKAKYDNPYSEFVLCI